MKSEIVDFKTHMKILGFLTHLQGLGIITDSQRNEYSKYVQDYLVDREEYISFMKSFLEEAKNQQK